MWEALRSVGVGTFAALPEKQFGIMNIDTSDLQKKGFIDQAIDPNLDLVAEIQRLKKEKNAVILAHYYQSADIQDIADFVGDSLALAQKAATTTADIIVFAGVHFMAETAKTLSPQKKVLLPDLNAGCSLADSCPPEAFRRFVEAHPGHTVVSYVNTSNAIKVLTDIVVTSTNAKQIIDTLPPDEKIIFGPDRNLGNYINGLTGRQMVLWDGACHVHQDFSLEGILLLKKQYPQAKVLAHPECPRPVLLVADHIGSTKGLLDFSTHDSAQEYIVATEWGIIHQMQKASPEKRFIPAPPETSEEGPACGCNECNFMRLNTLQKLYNCMRFELPEIVLPADQIQRAYLPIRRMLDISAQLGL